MPSFSNIHQRPANMASAVRSSTAGITVERIPRSFPAAHPGYGANALAALDEKLADELADRKRRFAARAAAAGTATTTTPSEHVLSLSEIDARLATARGSTQAAKAALEAAQAAYSAALAAERGLATQRGVVLERGEEVKSLKERREEKMRRREKALALASGGGGVGAKPVGMRKKMVVKRRF